MIRRTAIVSTVALAIMLALALSTAVAATSSQIIRDAEDDCVIDGTYTLAEINAADRSISPQEREYTLICWEQASAEYRRHLANPDAPRSTKPPTIPPRDENGNGTIDPDEAARAAALTRKARAKFAAAAKKRSAEDAPAEDDAPSDTVVARDDDDDGSSPWLLALLAIPAAIIGFGLWRMRRGRRPDERPGDDLP